MSWCSSFWVVLCKGEEEVQLNFFEKFYRLSGIFSLILFLQFPYYEFVDRDAMYTVGSLFYAIYFFVSFPMFLR